MLRITVNGEPRDVPDGCTVTRLLDELGAVRERVAVEINQHVVRRADHGTHRLDAGDRVEVVGFVGGG